MTGTMDEFFRSVQKFLMKKEQQYGQLKFLLSRATTETSNNIDQLVQGIIEIFDEYEILPIDRDMKSNINIETKPNLKIVESYRCLLLNTHFSVQLRLAEDTLHGYLVDMWPALSPYLFIQMVWGLRCESLLMESILHTPLELCLEILEISSKCVMELEFERALRFIIDLLSYTYGRCFMLNTEGTQTSDLEESRMQYLIANFQTLLDKLTKITRLCELSELTKHERHGIILKSIIRMTKICMEMRLKGGITSVSQKLYMKLTFGNEDYYKLTTESLKSIVTTLDNELIALLLNQIKQVDCHMYIAWAELDDQENVLLTLQRAIAIECYYFMQFMDNDIALWQNDQLRDCLQQLVGPNSKESTLTLHELCESITSGRTEGMKELMRRYCEWNRSILDFIYEWWSLLDKDNYQILFEYLNYMFSMPCSETEKYQHYSIILTILMKRDLVDVYDITIAYMLRYFDYNFLEPFYVHEHLEDFILRNTNIRDSLNLKSLLMFLLLNPKRVLSVLIRIAIGSVAYNHIVFTPHDMLLMRPFLCVQWDIDSTYLTYVLRDVCMQHDHWDTKKFTHFIQVMLDAKVASSDDLMNNVFIPYLAEKLFDKHNINCILINIRKIMNTCTHNMNVVALCTMLARKMSTWRKCNSLMSRSLVNQVLANMMRVLDNYIYRSQRTSVLEKRMIIDAVMAYVEPLDKANLAPFLYLIGSNILDIINDYKRRCFPIYRRLKLEHQYINYIYKYITTLKLEREDFIRHVFLHATDIEYQKYSFELAIVYWRFFGWSSEIDAYDNVLRITMEAARIALEYPYDVPCDSFTALLRQSINFYQVFVKVDHMCSQEEMILRILLKNLSYISQNTEFTQYSSLYKCFRQLDCSIERVNLHCHLQEIMELINGFIYEGSKLTGIPGEINNFDYSLSEDLYDVHEAYIFIHTCMSVFENKYHRCIDKMERILFGDADNN